VTKNGGREAELHSECREATPPTPKLTAGCGKSPGCSPCGSARSPRLRPSRSLVRPGSRAKWSIAEACPTPGRPIPSNRPGKRGRDQPLQQALVSMYPPRWTEVMGTYSGRPRASGWCQGCKARGSLRQRSRSGSRRRRWSDCCGRSSGTWRNRRDRRYERRVSTRKTDLRRRTHVNSTV
jgi:hypothetical protein